MSFLFRGQREITAANPDQPKFSPHIYIYTYICTYIFLYVCVEDNVSIWKLQLHEVGLDC